MEIKIGSYWLTDEHVASRYGLGVLADEDGEAYGPADILPTCLDAGLLGGTPDPLDGYALVAHELVGLRAAAAQMERYLSQDPRGIPVAPPADEKLEII